MARRGGTRRGVDDEEEEIEEVEVEDEEIEAEDDDDDEIFSTIEAFVGARPNAVGREAALSGAVPALLSLCRGSCDIADWCTRRRGC